MSQRLPGSYRWDAPDPFEDPVPAVRVPLRLVRFVPELLDVYALSVAGSSGSPHEEQPARPSAPQAGNEGGSRGGEKGDEA